MEKEAKTFPEIWGTLTPEQQGEIRIRIIGELRITDATFWRWQKGLGVPGTFVYKAITTRIINEVLGTEYTSAALFPEKK